MAKKSSKSAKPDLDWMGNIITGKVQSSASADAQLGDVIELAERAQEVDGATDSSSADARLPRLESVSTDSAERDEEKTASKLRRSRSMNAKYGKPKSFSDGFSAVSKRAGEAIEEECRNEQLEFRPRHIPLVAFDWLGFVYYALLLSFFLFHTLRDRGHAFYFTEYARQVGDVEHFMQIDDGVAYLDWFETAFLPNIHYNSVNRTFAGAPGIALVGPPRVRAVRAKGAFRGTQPYDGNGFRPTNCGQAAETEGFEVVCFDLSADELETAEEKGTSWFDEVAPWWDDGAQYVPPGFVDGTPETCLDSDCSTGYVAGTVGAPSSTCPSGCTLTAAVADAEAACTEKNGLAIGLDAEACAQVTDLGSSVTCLDVRTASTDDADDVRACVYAAATSASLETCEDAEVVDCSAGYIPGTPNNPSTTCPSGCTLTPAAAAAAAEDDIAPEPEPNPVTMEYFDGETLEENVYSSYTGITYPPGGHVLRNIEQLFYEPPNIYKLGTELYPWARYQISAQKAVDAGLLHPATRAIFHDFTIYSATKDAYVNVRLVLEIGLEHGMYIPSKHIRIVWLTDFPESRVVFEVAFYVLLVGLAIETIYTWFTHVLECDVVLQERMTVSKYELSFELCRQAAFKNIFLYRPKILLEQIKQRVDEVASSRSYHIGQLNRLGKQTEALHRSFQEFILANNKRSDNPVDKAEAILSVLSDLADTKAMQQELDLLEESQIRGCSARLSGWRVRCRNATHLFFADPWRVIDVLNYGIFFITFFIMLTVFALMDKAQDDVASLDRNDPWSDANYVGFYRVSYWTNSIQRYAYAMNTVLTWLKCFKFLAYFPSMEILTRTMKYASRPLGSFSIIMMVVLFAFGQAYFLAFGLDVIEYRTIFTSFFSLLRMSVGDFNYDAFEQSHNKVGPVLFWMYIFVVFFILMSVFIALISEAYEQAKEEIEIIAKAGQEGPPLLTGSDEDPQNAVAEARERLKNVAPKHVSKLLMDIMQNALPPEDAPAGDAGGAQDNATAESQTASAGLSTVVSRIQDLKHQRTVVKWASGPLSHSWSRPKGARTLDYMENGEMDWLKRIRPSVASKMKSLGNRASNNLAKKKVAKGKLPV